jgi:hypothetical protein
VIDFQLLSFVGVGYQLSCTFGEVLTAPSELSSFIVAMAYQLL